MGVDSCILSDGALPTEDIYFDICVGDYLRQNGHRIIKINSQNFWIPKSLFLPWIARSQIIICRSLAPSWINFIQSNRSRFGTIYYLIDDDLEAGASSAELPRAYRERLKGLAAAQQLRLLPLVDEVIATSDYLASRFEGVFPRVSVLEPPLISPLPSLDHFSLPRMTIGYHGTRAHLQDVHHIAPSLVRIHNDFNQVDIEVMLGKFTPRILLQLPRVSTPKPLSWSSFRSYQRRTRVHIGLAPLLDTGFNRGKSHIKFLDIAAMGGVGVYSNRYPYTEVVEHGVDGLLVDDDPAAWYAALRQLIMAPEKTREMAMAAAKKAALIGDPERVIQFWRMRL